MVSVSLEEGKIWLKKLKNIFKTGLFLRVKALDYSTVYCFALKGLKMM